MDLIAESEADYIRLAVELGATPEAARAEWDELCALKKEEEDGD